MSKNKALLAQISALALGAYGGAKYGLNSAMTAKTYTPHSRWGNKEYFKRPNMVKNPDIAKQMNEMHAKWEREQFPSRVIKLEPQN